MSLLSTREKLKEKQEIVICDSEIAVQSHRELFRFNDEAYIKTEGIMDALSEIASLSPSDALSKIHLVLNWEHLMQVTAWINLSPKPAPECLNRGSLIGDARPAACDILTVIRKAGVNQHELQPFKTSGINDLFPWLYYGKRFDVLRKLCHAAKKQIEGHLKNNLIRVDCHLVAEDTKRIVASTL